MIQLSDHFTYKRLFRFTYSAILMLIFTSIYGIVDGFFVSNFVGKNEFVALNYIYPVLSILGSIGFMFGTGGTALISKYFGENNPKKANEIFSMNTYISFLIGIVLAIISYIFLPDIAYLLNARDELLDNAVLYGRIIIIALPFYILQYEFQALFSTSGKPKMGFIVTLLAGVTNMILDAVFIKVFNLGLAGAAIATAISQFIGAIIPIIYYARKNSSLLKLGKFVFDGKALLKTCTNGSSEFLSNISMSIVSMLYNYQLKVYAGDNGVAAYGVLMYVSLIFQSIFIGYSIGVAPIVGYNYGSQNDDEMKNIFKKSIIIISIFSVLMFMFGEFLSTPFAKLFTSYDLELLEITKNAFKIFSFCFLFSGFSIFSSSFFTALNNGAISAIISFMRTMVCQLITVIVLPIFFELNGIWFSIVIAEVFSLIISFIFLITNKKKYNYY